MGAGTTQAPYRIDTVVDAGTTGIRLTHDARYVVGEESYRTDITLPSTGTLTRSLILYRAADCVVGVLSGAVGCAVNADNVPAGRPAAGPPATPSSSTTGTRLRCRSTRSPTPHPTASSARRHRRLIGDPVISGRNLTWTTALAVPSLGASMLHFEISGLDGDRHLRQRRQRGRGRCHQRVPHR